MRRRALLSGSVATLAMLPETVRAQWVDCGGLVPAVVAGPCVPIADLDLTFMSPGTLDPRITFTRASTGTYFDSAGVMQTAAINAPRWDYDPVTRQLLGLLLEDARTNLLLNSATLSTQSVTVTAQAYTLSFYGTGTITKSGTATGALVGTGAGQRVSQTFTPTAGTLTLTVTGTVSNAQIEAGGFATSYIPTTAATVTRAIDSCTVQPASMGWFTSPGGSWFAEFIMFNPAPTVSTRVVGRIGATSATPLFLNSSRFVGQSDSVSMLTANVLTANVVNKATSTWTAGQAKVCSNANTVASSAALVTGYGVLAGSGIYLLMNTAVPADSMMGYMRAIRYWSTVLSDAQMQAITS